MGFEIHVQDVTGKRITEGDILQDNVSSRGIVKINKDKVLVTPDYKGRDIQSIEKADELDQQLVTDNFMYIIGNVNDNPELIY